MCVYRLYLCIKEKYVIYVWVWVQLLGLFCSSHIIRGHLTFKHFPRAAFPLLSSLHRRKALCSHSWEHLAFQGFIEEQLKSQKTTEIEIVLSPCSIFCSSAEALGGKSRGVSLLSFKSVREKCFSFLISFFCPYLDI